MNAVVTVAQISPVNILAWAEAYVWFGSSVENESIVAYATVFCLLHRINRFFPYSFQQKYHINIRWCMKTDLEYAALFPSSTLVAYIFFPYLPYLFCGILIVCFCHAYTIN